MILKINERYRLSCGGYAHLIETKSVMIDDTPKLRYSELLFYAGVYPPSGEEHHGYYDTQGQFYSPCGTLLEDDPFRIVGPFVEPKTIYFLADRGSGELLESATGPMPYKTLEAAQIKCEALGWTHKPVPFLEQQNGVR